MMLEDPYEYQEQRKTISPYWLLAAVILVLGLALLPFYVGRA